MTHTFTLGDHVLRSGAAPYIVAEIGINHNCQLSLAKETIDAAATAGADAVKFQTFHAKEFMADRDVRYEYESAGERVSESMYEMFKRLELPMDWHVKLQEHAHSKGLIFVSSAADRAAVDLLISLGVPAIKIASEDLINIPLLRYVARKRVPIILSTGMADQSEVDHAVTILRDGGCRDLLLLHCVSLYPTPEQDANILRMTRLRDRYGILVGFSDHTLGWEAAMVATSLGAVLIEKHFTLDKSLEGPDHAISANPDELAELVRRVRQVVTLLGSPKLAPSDSEKKRAHPQFRRSVVAAVPIPEGTMIQREMLTLKRPGTGIHPRDMDKLVGARAHRSFELDEQLEWQYLDGLTRGLTRSQD